jgi:hypothetical protein
MRIASTSLVNLDSANKRKLRSQLGFDGEREETAGNAYLHGRWIVDLEVRKRSLV